MPSLSPASQHSSHVTHSSAMLLDQTSLNALVVTMSSCQKSISNRNLKWVEFMKTGGVGGVHGNCWPGWNLWKLLKCVKFSKAAGMGRFYRGY